MGITRVTVKVLSVSGKGTPYEADFLVDTGSLHCLVAAEHLRAAGIEPVGKSVYELADGQPVEYEHGYANFTFMGDTAVARVIFGPQGVEPILGVLALEDVGLAVDPATRTLKRLHALPLK